MFVTEFEKIHDYDMVTCNLTKKMVCHRFGSRIWLWYMTAIQAHEPLDIVGTWSIVLKQNVTNTLCRIWCRCFYVT